MRSAAFHTLGCKVNSYETEAMRQELLRAGYEIRSFEEKADVYIINTCSVTNMADRKSRQMIRRARGRNAAAVVVAAGCYAQSAGEALREELEVDLILGNHEKREIAAALERYFSGRPSPQTAVGDMASVRSYDDLSAETMTGHTRAFLKIQDGCNQFCSYCIIPYVRGRVRSRRPEEILKEAEGFAARGFRELVLTGIHLSSYGKDFSSGGSGEEAAPDLVSVMELLDGIPGVERVRVGSLEPLIVTEAFLRRLKKLRHFCPHFHLSLQSGSDSVLRRMNRRYTAAEYRRGAELIREYFPEAALTTDVIVGFPGETEEEFLESEALIREIHFFETHIFPYSAREGTKAAAMKGQRTRAEKAVRARRLSELNRRRIREFLEKRIGREEEILTEERIRHEGAVYFVGSTAEYVRAAIPLREGEEGRLRENCLVRGRIAGFLKEDMLLMERAEALR